MKLIGARLMIWSGIAILASLAYSLIGSVDNPAILALNEIFLTLGSLAVVTLLAGVVIYFTAPKSQRDSQALTKAGFWMGVLLAVTGLALPGFFVYEMLFVPGGGDAIFLVMIFGPFGLAMLIPGIVMMVRSRK